MTVIRIHPPGEPLNRRLPLNGLPLNPLPLNQFIKTVLTSTCQPLSGIQALGNWGWSGVEYLFVNYDSTPTILGAPSSTTNSTIIGGGGDFGSQMEHIIHLLSYHTSELLDSKTVSIKTKNKWLILKPEIDRIISDMNIIPINMKEKMSKAFNNLRYISNHGRTEHGSNNCDDNCIDILSDIIESYPNSLMDSFINTFNPIFNDPDFLVRYMTPLNTNVTPIELVNQCREYLLDRLYLLQCICQDMNKNLCQRLNQRINILFDIKYNDAIKHFSQQQDPKTTPFDPYKCAQLMLLQQETIRVGQTIQDLLRNMKLKFNNHPNNPIIFIQNVLLQSLNQVNNAIDTLFKTLQD